MGKANNGGNSGYGLNSLFYYTFSFCCTVATLWYLGMHNCTMHMFLNIQYSDVYRIYRGRRIQAGFFPRQKQQMLRLLLNYEAVEAPAHAIASASLTVKKLFMIKKKKRRNLSFANLDLFGSELFCRIGIETCIQIRELVCKKEFVTCNTGTKIRTNNSEQDIEPPPWLKNGEKGSSNLIVCIHVFIGPAHFNF